MQMVTLSEISKMFGVTQRTVYNWRKKGHLPQPVRIGGVLRWRKEIIDSFDGKDFWVTLPTNSGSMVFRIVSPLLRVEPNWAAFKTSDGQWQIKNWGTQTILDIDDTPILLACEDSGIETVTFAEFSRRRAS